MITTNYHMTPKTTSGQENADFAFFQIFTIFYTRQSYLDFCRLFSLRSWQLVSFLQFGMTLHGQLFDVLGLHNSFNKVTLV